MGPGEGVMWSARASCRAPVLLSFSKPEAIDSTQRLLSHGLGLGSPVLSEDPRQLLGVRTLPPWLGPSSRALCSVMVAKSPELAFSSFAHL